jgi:hypothetical protein
MDIIEAIQAALAWNNNRYPISIIHRNQKDKKGGLYDLFVVFSDVNTSATQIMVRENYPSFVVNGGTFSPTILDYIYSKWEVSNKIPQLKIGRISNRVIYKITSSESVLQTEICDLKRKLSDKEDQLNRLYEEEEDTE